MDSADTDPRIDRQGESVTDPCGSTPAIGPTRVAVQFAAPIGNERSEYAEALTPD